MNATMYILCCLLIFARGDTGKLIKCFNKLFSVGNNFNNPCLGYYIWRTITRLLLPASRYGVMHLFLG
jgi:hypothetical protein